jgi:hypothetical protein
MLMVDSLFALIMVVATRVRHGSDDYLPLRKKPFDHWVGSFSLMVSQEIFNEVKGNVRTYNFISVESTRNVDLSLPTLFLRSAREV